MHTWGLESPAHLNPQLSMASYICNHTEGQSLRISVTTALKGRDNCPKNSLDSYYPGWCVCGFVRLHLKVLGKRINEKRHLMSFTGCMYPSAYIRSPAYSYACNSHREVYPHTPNSKREFKVPYSCIAISRPALTRKTLSQKSKSKKKKKKPSKQNKTKIKSTGSQHEFSARSLYIRFCGRHMKTLSWPPSVSQPQFGNSDSRNLHL